MNDGTQNGGEPQPWGQDDGKSAKRPGRALGPIAPHVAATHRAWLEAVRDQLALSNLTVGEVGRRAGYSKGRISELLRGEGLYPTWCITSSVVHVLGMQKWPMLRLWTAAAREAHKGQAWIDECVDQVALMSGPNRPPVAHRALLECHRATYYQYARVFLPRHLARWVTTEVFDLLWLNWQAIVASPDANRAAWKVLRKRVVARATQTDKHPDLRGAAFSTQVLPPSVDWFAQVEESLTLFDAIGRLPAAQLDVVVLRHLCGLGIVGTAAVLGISQAAVRSDEQHAKRALVCSCGRLLPASGPGAMAAFITHLPQDLTEGTPQ